MTTFEIVCAVFGVLGTVAAIVFGIAAIKRNSAADTAEKGREDGMILTELGYIKSGVDRMERKQDKQDEQYVSVVQRVSAVESSAKQAHHRIDGIEQTLKNGGNK